MTHETLAAALGDAVRRRPGRPAIQHGERVITYGELEQLSARLARAYRDLGVRRGDRIVCQVGNRPEHLIAAVTAWNSAAVHVAADHDLTGAELCGHLARAGATVLLYAPIAGASDPYRPALVVQEDRPEVRIIVAGGDPPPGMLDFDELIRGAAPDRPDPPAAGDPAAIFTTSGSTGTPKMPMGYHGKLHRSWTHLGGDELGFEADDVHLAYLPLAHGLGLMLTTAALLRGGKVVLLERFSAAAVLPLVERERVTVLHGSPTHFTLLLDRLASARHDVGSLRIGVASGAAFAPALLRRILDELGMGLMLMYGASEGVGVGTTDRAEMLAGSVGRPMPGSVAVLDPQGRPVAPGEAGEIAFSREISPVRYWQPPSEGVPAGPGPAQAGGWYHSGDLGRFDQQGLLYVLGRIRDQINRGGLKVDPVEVERALLRCAEVADAAVLGVPDPVLGQVVCACVVPAAGRTVSLPALRESLAPELARHKMPEELRVLGRIPRTGLGKVDAELLRACSATAEG